MACPQCGATAKSTGARCKRKTCKYAPHCFHHSSVQINPSQIAGRGLFAKKAIRKGEVVADYTFADKITSAQFQAKKRAGTATHIALINGQYFDASDASTTVAGMANRAPRGRRNNVKLTGAGKVRAQRHIAAGSELLMGYGNAFRM